MTKEEYLLEALNCCSMEPTEDFIPCDHCPMMKEHCDEGIIEYRTLPAFLVDEIRLVLTERASEPMTKQRWLS